MSPARPIQVRYRGRLMAVPCDVHAPLAEFREAVCVATGVPVERQRLVSKGKLLRDVGMLAGPSPPVLHLIGTQGSALPEPPPSARIVFAEDIPEPAPAPDPQRTGLVNLGHTCYLNSTLQVIRSISELRAALELADVDDGSHAHQMARGLRDLFRQMDQSVAAVPPTDFLAALRLFAPQFAERASDAPDAEFLPQDASEVWSMAMEALEATLPALIHGRAGAPVSPTDNFVTQYMGGRMTVTRSCPHAPDEPASTYEEPFTLVSCPITGQTEDLVHGLLAGWSQEIEKHSPTLGRTVSYEERSRISRLPRYLAVHFARFYWRRDVGQKTKILRRVHFPLELDTWPLLTDDLRRRTRPAASAMRKIEWDRQQRRTARAHARAAMRRRDLAVRTWDVERDGGVPDAEEWKGSVMSVCDAELMTPGEEAVRRREEERVLHECFDVDLAADPGTNPTGLYELAGLVTHKGPATENGHYMGWAKQPQAHDGEALDDDDHARKRPAPVWYRFADEEVGEFTDEDVVGLKGGTAGNSLAYILLYRSKSLD